MKQKKSGEKKAKNADLIDSLEKMNKPETKPLIEIEESEIEQEFTESMYNQMEEEEYHIPYTEEMGFYQLVKQGCVEQLASRTSFLVVRGQGVLSDDDIQNYRYHFVISTALITRFCVEGGLNKDQAYTLSDIYIRKMDKLNAVEEINMLHREMVLVFARIMKDLKKTLASSKYIRSCIEYISNNFTHPLKIKQIADNIGLSEKYLSSLFKKETGMSLVNYIEKVRLQEACRMLVYTDYSYGEISDSLCFSSQSYFIKVFKRCYGLTPLKYRITKLTEIYESRKAEQEKLEADKTESDKTENGKPKKEKK